MAVPILKSSDLDRSLAFFIGVLGARVVWRERPGPGPGYSIIQWREHELRVSSHAGDSAFGAAVYFSVADVDAVFAELQTRGWKPRTDRGPVFEAPTDQTWGMRELCVTDPDGNVLVFGTPSPRQA